jgi:hypothetical protein
VVADVAGDSFTISLTEAIEVPLKIAWLVIDLAT